mmetsp:Transcript_13044/g.23247  ORF Transcript_13044/g.23247 Transcript_13044/m.23247 type:complete len:271 (+) Transcript_13044:298-1110(+)
MAVRASMAASAGNWPSSFRTANCSKPPRSSSRATAAAWPLAEARWRARFRSSDRKFGSAPESRRRPTTSTCPREAAMCSGVRPPAARASVQTSTVAPAAKRTSTAFGCPAPAARCSAVAPARGRTVCCRRRVPPPALSELGVRVPSSAWRCALAEAGGPPSPGASSSSSRAASPASAASNNSSSLRRFWTHQLRQGVATDLRSTRGSHCTPRKLSVRDLGLRGRASPVSRLRRRQTASPDSGSSKTVSKGSSARLLRRSSGVTLAAPSEF